MCGGLHDHIAQVLKKAEFPTYRAPDRMERNLDLKQTIIQCMDLVCYLKNQSASLYVLTAQRKQKLSV